MVMPTVREKVRLSIGGVTQGAFLRGPSTDAPVALFLHGGPGLPEFPLLRRYPSLLDQDVLVCWWEQRGAGLSYHRELRSGIAEEDLIADALEVTDHLRERFGQERIHLLAHSGGSHIGIQVAARSPERFLSYVGMAQITDQLASERLAWVFMRDEYARRGDRRMVRRLDAFPVPEMTTLPPAYRGLRDQAMHRLGIGTTHQMRSVITGIFLPTLVNRDYTLRERLDLWRGKWSPSSTALWDQIVATDVTARITRLAVPVHLLHGVHDLTVSYVLAREYFDRLVAPTKGFYTFEHSAHSPFIEEPERMQRILTHDVLHGRTDLADVAWHGVAPG